MPLPIRTVCENCNEETNHTVLFKKEVRINESKSKIDEGQEWYCVTQCAGCNTYSFVLRTFFCGTNDKDLDFYDMNYPSRVESFNFLSPDNESGLPNNISNLYLEVKEAFNSESPILAGIGLRTLVEAVCIQQNIAGGNLKEKIISLHKNGQISTTELPILDKLREIGNFSAHEIKKFSMDKLSYALDIINHVLISIYILPRINKKLKI